MSPEEQKSYDELDTKCNEIAEVVCTMLTRGTREYEALRLLVMAYIDFRFAADKISGQTDSSLGDL